MKTLSYVALGWCLVVSAVLASGSCSQCPPGDSRCNSGVGGGTGTGGGTGGSGGANAVYDIYTLDPTFSDRFTLDMVVEKSSGRVGIAYFVGKGEIPFIYGDGGLMNMPTVDAGTYELRYVEWQAGMTKPMQSVDVVRRQIGLSIDFHPTSGEPAIGYLGGGSDMSVYWDNSDAELAVRTGGTNWSKSAAATTGVQVLCGNPVSDNPGSIVVGVWPAIGYESNGNLWYCYRDVHSGQYPQQDWAGSDVECVRGGPGNWTRDCTYAAGNNKDGPGGRIDLTIVNDQPYITWDNALGGADTRGQNVWHQFKNGTSWSSARGVFTMSDTQSGGSVAYDPMEGVGVAAVDLADNILRYTNRALTSNSFNTADPVYGEGTGGWYPSLAMDPVNHEPAIAFYVCSPTSGQTYAQCIPSFDEVRVTQRVNNDWAGHTERVDDVSAVSIRLGFLSDGRKVVAYRERNGTLKLAVRKVP